MGALRRATRSEIEERVGDADWWPGVLASVRETGSITEIQGESAWSYGAFIGWIREDEKRSAQYDEALKDYVQGLALGTVEIANTPQMGETRKTKDDGSVEVTQEDMLGHRKLRIDTFFKLAGKVDRARWGEQIKVDRGGGTPLLDAALVGFAGALLERLASPRQQERVIGQVAADPNEI